jgi:hypothetical protein
MRCAAGGQVGRHHPIDKRADVEIPGVRFTLSANHECGHPHSYRLAEAECCPYRLTVYQKSHPAQIRPADYSAPPFDFVSQWAFARISTANYVASLSHFSNLIGCHRAH